MIRLGWPGNCWTDRKSAREAGFTLVEMMVAMGVFSVLMVIVGAATLTGFSNLRYINAASQTQQEAKNASEWILRLTRFIVIPAKEDNAITEATPTSLTFYTYSGAGKINDIPYKARIFVRTNTDGTRSLMTDLWTPQKVVSGGGWKWDWTPTSAFPMQERMLLTVPASANGPVSFTYYSCDPDDCFPTRGVVTPPVTGPLVIPGVEEPESILVKIGDANDPTTLLTQVIRLVNLT
jgi:prepilin-type N-terminal cleavage/methylation domain-containing protein